MVEKQDRTTRQLETSQQKLQEAAVLVAQELNPAREKTGKILAEAIKPLKELGLFPTMAVVRKFYGDFTKEAFFYGPDRDRGLVLRQDEESSLFLTLEGKIARAKTFVHESGALYVNIDDEIQEAMPEEYAFYANQALEELSKYIKENFLAKV